MMSNYDTNQKNPDTKYWIEKSSDGCYYIHEEGIISGPYLSLRRARKALKEIINMSSWIIEEYDRYGNKL